MRIKKITQKDMYKSIACIALSAGLVFTGLPGLLEQIQETVNGRRVQRQGLYAGSGSPQDNL